MLGLYRDTGKENGNYYGILVFYRVYIGMATYQPLKNVGQAGAASELSLIH